MEKELASKVFLLQEYASKENMEEHIKEYIRKLKEEYPLAMITREFFKGKNILVRATQISQIQKNKKELEMENELEKEEVRIKEKGLDTIVGEKGVKLSAGQKQRLNIIRGILIDKDLYFFDEPTSNLDALSEEKITNMIDKYLKNKTYVIVTHRPRLKELCNKHYIFENHMMKETVSV